MELATKQLRDQAERGRSLYRSSEITQKEAKEMVQPYLDAVNERGKELAKKFNVRPKKVGFKGFVR